MNTQDMLSLLTKARAQLLLSHPFFATLLLRLPVVPDTRCKIMATDGTALYCNPAGIAPLTLDEVKGVMVHECLHVAFQHYIRRGDREPSRWNMAGDYAINPTVTSAGLALPSGHLDSPAFHGRHAEEIYSMLPAPQTGCWPSKAQSQQTGNTCPPGRPPGGQQAPTALQQNVGQGATDGGSFGEVWDAPMGSEASLDTDWRIAIQQAVQAAKACGSMPAGMDRLVEISEGPRAPWFERLRRFVSATVVADFTWSRPSRRSAAIGVYLPSPLKSGVGSIDVAVDCSGSISDATLDAFCSRVAALHEELRPEQLRVIYFDTRVHMTDTFFPFDRVTMTAKGRGGTDVRSVFRWISDSDHFPKCLVVLTDLETPFPTDAPPYPTLWVSINREKTAPFGETVEIDEY